MVWLTDRIERFYSELDSQVDTVWVAYSGGKDSHVLLHLMCHLRDKHPDLSLSAIHINHQLQPESNDWERHCQIQCQDLDIVCVVERVDAHAGSRQSPEDAARQARYQAISQHMSERDILLTGHHGADQAETLLLQLMRGSGLAGLAAMPQQRQFKNALMFRPLLDVDRQIIDEYATQQGLKWIEDPSNEDTSIRRNFIRHEILPKLQHEWPTAIQSIQQSAANLANSMDVFQWFMHRELSLLTPAPDVMQLKALEQYPLEVQRHLIREWFRRLGIRSPGNDKLTIIFDQLINVRADANPELRWQDVLLHRNRDYLILSPDWGDITEHTWSGVSEITTSAWDLKLSSINSQQRSLVSVQVNNPDCKITRDNHSKSLRKLMKERGLPVTFRHILPMIYYDSQLIHVPGFFHHRDFSDIEVSFDFKRLMPDSTTADVTLLSALGID